MTFMEINRELLLNELRTVEGGVNKDETVEQSNCFVFQNGEILTYNDEVFCRTKCCLDITGAINANKMINMLVKWPEETINFEKKKGKLKFQGKAKRGYFKTEDKVTLPVKDVEKPKKWKDLPNELIQAINLVSFCASKGSNSPHLSCIHLTPEWVEACDGEQAGRYLVNTLFKKPVLLKSKAVKWAVNVKEMTSISETDNWVHFKNKAGLVVSCHKYYENYPNERLSAIFESKGSPAKFPKGLKGLSDRLKVFLDDDAENQWLKVEIDSTHIKVTGQGPYGLQSERKKIKYKGKPITFNINPQLFRDLTDKNDKCQISDQVIKIVKGRFKYITSLWIPDEKED